MIQLHLGFSLDLIHVLKTYTCAVVLHKGFSLDLKPVLRVLCLPDDFTQGLFIALKHELKNMHLSYDFTQRLFVQLEACVWSQVNAVCFSSFLPWCQSDQQASFLVQFLY